MSRRAWVDVRVVTAPGIGYWDLACFGSPRVRIGGGSPARRLRVQSEDSPRLRLVGHRAL
jgi:hypothetical protein